MSSPRPKSSPAQIVTAVAAVTALLVIVVAIYTFIQAAGVIGRGVVDGLGDTGAGRPLVQAACLSYADFVLEQHRAGQSVEQIEALMHNADRVGLEGHAAPDSYVVDSVEVCGPAADIIRLSGQ